MLFRPPPPPPPTSHLVLRPTSCYTTWEKPFDIVHFLLVELELKYLQMDT